MEYTFRSMAAWPHATTPPHARRNRHTFKAGWTDTLKLLGREIEKLNGKDVVIATLHPPYHVRQDGGLRANAPQPSHPGVEVSFEVVGSDPVTVRGRQIIRQNSGDVKRALRATHPDTRDPASGYDDQDYIAVVKSQEKGRAVYATDICDDWHHNVRSIALTLEALRACDRYGATQGRQYHGFAGALNAGPAS